MQKRKRPLLVLLDTHAIIHRAYHALPELTSQKGEPVGAVYGLATILMKIAKEFNPDYVIAAYDLPGPTHRHEVYKEYKATREKLDDALIVQIKRSRDMLAAFSIPVLEAPGFEADDVIGTLANHLKKNFDVIIASGDMDTLQLVDGERVKVFTLKKGIQDTVVYDEKKVVERFGFPPERIPDYKGFAGDPSDNIIGIPGIGDKTATALIKEFDSMEGVFKALQKDTKRFEKSGVRERIVNLLKEHQEEAEFSKVLATIRTDAPVTYAEPKVAFIDAFDVQRITTLFTELGFRSLVQRAETLKSNGGKKIESAEKTNAVFTFARSAPANDAGKALLKEAVVMLWLLNSELTNPTYDDVLNNTASETLEDAHAKLLLRLSKENLVRVYEDIEKPLIPVVDAMNEKGVLIDAAYLKTLSVEYHKKLDKRAALIHKAAGSEFNINSPKQLGEVLFTKLGLSGGKRQKKTATGQLSTKESELQKLADEHPIVGEILAYRELAKLLGTYIDAIPPLLDAESRLHTTFSQTGAATGRMSSRDPGIQNIPVKTELGRRIRASFTAPRGSVLLACDYSQIELRLAALLSKDEKLTDIFVRGEDVHAAVASQVFGLPQSEVTKEMRRRAKVINFGILYGMGVNALRENLGTDRAEAQNFYNKYFETYSGLAQYLEKTKASAARLGYTTTLFGRKRYFPGITSTLPFVRAQAERMAINAPIQGTQADIIKIAMARIHDRIKKEYGDGAFLILQIHDELVLEVRENLIESVSQDVKRLLEGVLARDELRGIPLLVTVEVGQNWGDMKKIG